MKSRLLISLALGVSLFALTGCGKDQDEAVKSYQSVDACRADIASDASQEERDKVTADCQRAFDQSRVEHESTVTHYVTMDACSALYEQCYQTNGGFVPFMSGFMLGYLSGSPVYHPYYYDRYHVVYTGGTRLGYYRSGYVVAPAGASWTRGYASVSVNRGAAPPPLSATRGVFGGSGSAFAARGGSSMPSVSRAAPASFAGKAAIVSTPVARGVFGGSAAMSASSSSG